METLQIGGVSCRALAEQFGTPLYVYDEAKLTEQARAAVSNFSSDEFDTEVVYASKAFSAGALFRLLADEGLGFDVVSGGELYCAMKTGVDMSRVYFHGNNKSDEEIAMALDARRGMLCCRQSEGMRQADQDISGKTDGGKSAASYQSGDFRAYT